MVAQSPRHVREQLTKGYANEGITGVAWRAYRVEDYTNLTPPGDRVEFVGVEWPEPVHGYCSVYEIHRIVRAGDGFRLRSWRLCRGTVVWAAAFDYSLTDNPDPVKQRPYEQFAYGITLDTRVVRIKAITADGRVSETTPFDGFWWISGKVNPDDYSVDRWDTIMALDAQGNVIFREEYCGIRYPRLECESYHEPPQP